MSNMKSLCAGTFKGSVVSDDPQDESWRREELTLGPVICEGEKMSMPLAVGQDRTRIWVIEPKGKQLHFYHIHGHDGVEDAVSRYGGLSVIKSGVKAQFPVDKFSQDLFRREGLDVSVTNVWQFDIAPGALLVYELNRDGRHFRAEFDLGVQR